MTLPGKPSELIVLALNDLEKCENDTEHYIINMYVWHEYRNTKDKCEVCLAGAVIAQTIHADYDENVTPTTIRSQYVLDSLRSLDYFRTGQVYWGCAVLGVNLFTTIVPEDRYIGPYPAEIWPEEHRDTDRALFKHELRKLAEEFKELGL